MSTAYGRNVIFRLRIVYCIYCFYTLSQIDLLFKNSILRILAVSRTVTSMSRFCGLITDGTAIPNRNWSFTNITVNIVQIWHAKPSKKTWTDRRCSLLFSMHFFHVRLRSVGALLHLPLLTRTTEYFRTRLFSPPLLSVSTPRPTCLLAIALYCADVARSPVFARL